MRERVLYLDPLHFAPCTMPVAYALHSPTPTQTNTQSFVAGRYPTSGTRPPRYISYLQSKNFYCSSILYKRNEFYLVLNS